MVGDSLSVGKFGEVVQVHLAQKYPVAAYASCGSSPEHWLSGEPDFITKCGYRQHTIDSDVFRDFVNGRPPRPTLTPKLAKLINRHKPTILIVQLGTNWMDRSLTDEQMSDYLDRFVGRSAPRFRGGNHLDRAAGFVALEEDAGESARADPAGGQARWLPSDRFAGGDALRRRQDRRRRNSL